MYFLPWLHLIHWYEEEASQNGTLPIVELWTLIPKLALMAYARTTKPAPSPAE
jgi:hypothetical protein